MTNVLIADDHQVVIDGLSTMIQDIQGFTVVGSAKNGWQVLEYMDEHDMPDILLMDITMPELDGMETMEKMQETDLQPKTIILSMHLSVAYARKFLALGAKGYLQKDCARHELVQALKDVAQGGTYLSKNMTELLTENDHSAETGLWKSKMVKISAREKSVLNLILQEHSSRKIAELLGISFNTVETHRKHLLNKFGVKSTVGLIREAMRCGLLD